MENINEKNTAELHEEGQTATETEKTYKAEEVQKLLQQEADRRVTAALKKQQAEYEKKLTLLNLDETQRATAEKDMRIQELQEQLMTFTIEKNKSELKSVLGNRGLPPQFADLIEVGDDIEEAHERINQLERLFKNAVAEEVKKRLATGTPKAGIVVPDQMTKEEFKKLTLNQQAELFVQNPELYKTMTA